MRAASRWLIKTSLMVLFCLAAGMVVLPHAVSAALPKDVAESRVYVVRKGDTLSGIGRKHGLPVALLKSLNSLRNDRIKPGQRLLLEHPAAIASGTTKPASGGLRGVISSYLATPYRFGGTGSDGVDCSAFVQQVYHDLDISLPRSAREQYWYGEEVDKDELRSGDLLFFRTYALYPSHVGIYLGDGKMVHASARSHKVVASDITLPYYRKRYIGAKRFVSMTPELFDVAALDVVTEEPVEDEVILAHPGAAPLLSPNVKDQ